MKATSSHQKYDIMLRRGLLVVLALLVTVLYSPERNMSCGALQGDPACMSSSEGAAEHLGDLTCTATAGIKSNVFQTQALAKLVSPEVTLADVSTSWGAWVAAFKPEEQYDYHKVVDYLFGQVLKGITGISRAEYETFELVPPLLLQPCAARPELYANQLAAALPLHTVRAAQPATAEQAQLAFVTESGRGEYIVLSAAE